MWLFCRSNLLVILKKRLSFSQVFAGLEKRSSHPHSLCVCTKKKYTTASERHRLLAARETFFSPQRSRRREREGETAAAGSGRQAAAAATQCKAKCCGFCLSFFVRSLAGAPWRRHARTHARTRADRPILLSALPAIGGA